MGWGCGWWMVARKREKFWLGARTARGGAVRPREAGHFIHPSTASPRAEAERLTREVMKLIDAEVRARPGEWYWYNKRWILQPA